jgi:hypothetical protein
MRIDQAARDFGGRASQNDCINSGQMRVELGQTNDTIGVVVGRRFATDNGRVTAKRFRPLGDVATDMAVTNDEPTRAPEFRK